MTSREVRKLARRYVRLLPPGTSVYITGYGKAASVRAMIHRIQNNPVFPEFMASCTDDWPAVPLGEFGPTLEALRGVLVARDVMES